MKSYILFFLTIFAIGNLFAQQPMNHNSVVEINESEVYYEEGKFLLKLHDRFAHIDLSASGSGTKGIGITAITELNFRYGVKLIRKLFPFVRKINLQPHDLTTVYEIEYKFPISPIEISKFYSEIPEVEFAEPDYIASILINPNDPYYQDGSQWYHDDVKAQQAWELTTGDATQIIGIIDTGIDWGHNDLTDNIWKNIAELNGQTGVDDDNNGFVDDIRGWDFVNDDNNPMDDNSHGTHVAGIAGAKTNNNIGIAGISWNSKLMAIKVMQSSGRGSWSDIAQGAAYSAENGSTVINMSLGGYTESLTMKTTLENAYHYSVLVAAAGNDGLCMKTECPPPTPTAAMFPACYPWVLGVQAPARWSNYDPTGPTAFTNIWGYNYEVLAPGTNIYSTIPNNGYRYLSGTSMATPVTSGAVALIKSYLPNISTEELFARIIQASGSGVLDIEGAMTIELVPDIRLNKFAILDTLDGCDRDGVADAGETVILNIEARNYGGFAQNVKAKIRFGEFEDTSTLTIDDSTAAFGNVSAYARVNNDANPFQLTISNDVSNDRDIVLQLEISNDTDETKYFKNIVITAQNGEELKGNNPGLTHLTANRYYLLTENAVFDSLIIDPGVMIHAYSNTNIGIGNYFNCNGKIDSLITLKGINDLDWNFIKPMITRDSLYFNYTIISNIYTLNFLSDYIFSNCLFVDNSYVAFQNYSKLIKSIISSNNLYPFWVTKSEITLVSNNSVYNPYYAYFGGWWSPQRSSYLFNSMFNNFYNSQRIHSLLGVYYPENGIYQFELLPNYFGSNKQKDIDFEILDYFENSTLPITNCSNFLTEPHPDVHGHAWAILLNNENPYYKDLDPYGNETVKFDVFFSRSMDTSVTPFLTFGVREPYTQKAVVDSARWINWKRDSLVGDTYYDIKISTDSTFATVDFEKNDVLGLDYQFDLDPDKHYYWRVRYKNGTNGEWQKWSEVSNFWTKPSTAPNPHAITHPQNGDDDLWTDFQIKCEEYPYSTGYEIQIDDDNTFATPIINDSTHYLKNYYDLGGLERGETYFLRVRTNNAYGTSEWSDIVSFEVVGDTPVAPALVYPYNNQEGVNYYRIQFKWSDLDWAESYRIQISYDSLFNNLKVNYTTSESTYSDYYGFTSSNFYWRVQGIRESLVGDWSEIFHFTGNDEDTESDVTVISPADSSTINVGEYVTFKWEHAYNAGSYQIEIYDSYNKSNLLYSESINFPDSTYNYSELLNIGEYFWRIRVLGKNNWEEWSKLYMFEITKDLDPKPLLSVPTNNMKWYDTTLTFKWNNAPGANTVYNARWQAYHTMDFTTGDGLQMIRVAGAKDNEGFEIPIEWNRFQFEVQATAALSNDFIAEGKVGKIDLEWGMPDVERDILGFNLYRFVQKDSVTWGDTVKVNNILIVDSSFVDYNIIPDSTYYYVYRIVRTTLDEGEDSRMVSASAYPTVLDPPNMLYPPKDTTKLPVSILFDWDEPSGATAYVIQISRNIDFTDIFINQEVVESQYLATGLSNRTDYFWRVKADGVQGTSVWSEMRKFKTIPVLPAVPVLVFPENNSVEKPLSMNFDWENANEADSYQLQIADDNYFGNIIHDISGILASQNYISNLGLNKTYYWRVRSKNDAGLSGWSSKFSFTTDSEGAAEPPASWAFTDFTGNSSTIIVPTSINPMVNERPILAGDAVGIFYNDDGIYKSAGYGIWDGNNLAITVWGDDDQTVEKDGFEVSEPYKIKLWDSRAEKEFFATFSIASGLPYYTIDGFTVLASLESNKNVEQTLDLRSGWNLISGYVIPENDSLEVVFDAISNKLVILKNNTGLVYIPSFGINTIGKWNYMEGYQAYMNTQTNHVIYGVLTKPENELIIITSGWNTTAYLRNTAKNIEECLVTLTESNSLTIAKNNAGEVYIPSFGINTIGTMKPGQGYKLYLTKKDTLIYPANSLGRAGSGNITPTPEFLSPIYKETGNSSVAILKTDLPNGDEIGVYNQNDELIGSGVVHNGYAAVTIWGDNDQTEETDGAKDNYELRIKSYEIKTGRLSDVMISDLVNYTNGEKLTGLNYQKDAVYFAKETVENNKSTISLNVRPNPASEIIEIELETPDCKASELKIYSLNGELIKDITGKLTDSNYQKIKENIDNLTNGDYTIILTCGNERAMRKVVVVR